MARHPLIRQRYPVLTEALLAGASPQLRNMATVGGNLLQRTRCHYFNDPAFAECNKRTTRLGLRSAARLNRMHAILGASAECVATHPCDMAVALAALDAVVEVRGPVGDARHPHRRLPSACPEGRLTWRRTCARSELITAVYLPAMPFAGRSHYFKVRDRSVVRLRAGVGGGRARPRRQRDGP